MADTDPDIPRGPLQGLQDLAKSLGGDPSQPQMGTFMRGLWSVRSWAPRSRVRRSGAAAAIRPRSCAPCRRHAAAAIPPQPGPDESDQNLDLSTSSTTIASPPSIGPEISGGGTGAPEASPDQT